MKIRLHESVLEEYPDTQIGFLVANVSVKKQDPFVENLKLTLKNYLEQEKISATTFVTHPSISTWRQIYQNRFLVNPKTYRSSIEALIKRVMTGKEIWNISNLVDLYNCCSILSLLPMGGYDLQKVKGNIQIRFANQGETFLGLGEKTVTYPTAQQVVYADDDKIMCWLWNYKDCKETAINFDTEQVIFFIDSFDENKTKEALHLLSNHLQAINGKILNQGILNKENICFYLS